MPEWMKPFEKYIFNASGASIEEIKNRKDEIYRVQFIGMLMVSASIESQIKLLEGLHKDGFI
jgi:hypothetical protein